MRSIHGQRNATQIAGMSLPELLVALTIVSILIGIAAPNWLGWHHRNLLKAAQDKAFQAIRQTQLRAIQTRQNWQIGFRTGDNHIEWAIYPSQGAPSHWETLPAGIQLAPADTTLSQNRQGFFIEFTDRGNVMPPLGRLSLATHLGDRRRSCVFVSTVLGAMRKATDRHCRVAP